MPGYAIVISYSTVFRTLFTVRLAVCKKKKYLANTNCTVIFVLTKFTFPSVDFYLQSPLSGKTLYKLILSDLICNRINSTNLLNFALNDARRPCVLARLDLVVAQLI